jgi:A/G-specific adenine glycosylase
MLQQTGVERVVAHYGSFLARFPSARALAHAPVRDVLAAWKGLGYNRRALYLKRAAQVIVADHGGRVPRTMEGLTALPGVGRATAAAILAYAFNQPAAFIETNVRRVYIHFFFPRARIVSDSQILPLVERTLDRGSPRDWYDALMDYGTMLRSEGEDPNRRSSRYRRQAPFEGSVRQVRGRILEALLGARSLDRDGLAEATGVRDSRLAAAVEQLRSEGFIVPRGRGWRITPGSRRPSSGPAGAREASRS